MFIYFPIEEDKLIEFEMKGKLGRKNNGNAIILEQNESDLIEMKKGLE